MRILTAAAVGAGIVMVANAGPGAPGERAATATDVPVPPAAAHAPALTSAELTATVQRYCVVCHNDRLLTGNISFQTLDVGKVAQQTGTAEKAEKMIRKLRAEMMPPPGAPRPGGDTLTQLVEALEKNIDAAFKADPNPGTRMFQRLNRAEYEAAIKDLLGLDVHAGDWLPIDPRSENFDDIADAQTLSPTLLDGYLRAAAAISRMVVGVPDAQPTSVAYTNTGYNTQYKRMPGAPRGTRGGISVVHTFPADGDYVFKMWFEHTTTGAFMGTTLPGERLDISIDGEQVALLELDRWMNPADPQGASMSTDPIHVTAGPHRVSAAFLQLNGGLIEDLTSPHEWSMTDRNAGSSVYGLTNLAHMKDLYIEGPQHASGVSDNSLRRALFTCHPKAPAEERACAQQIVTRLANKAYRRPVGPSDIDPLMTLYDERAKSDGFEVGVRTALQAILAMPDFVFRMEEVPSGVKPGQSYKISDLALASRLSFFLWGAPPDEELLEVARGGKLSNTKVLAAQARRMLADSKAQALGTRFAYQWLRLEDLDKVQPDRQMFPNYHQQLADAMKKETEVFFYNLVKEDKSFLEAFNADYTFVNERLAKHYGILGVAGESFVKVRYTDGRRGLLGHASILMSTSHANRTSPVLRGKWVMEVLMGTPPPPPPPGVPTLEETKGDVNGRLLTTRERMEIHRKAPICAACHKFMDPIGLALDNFDVVGKWRYRENGQELDTRGDFYDGTRVTNPAELTAVLLKRPVPLTRSFTQNLMAYALGRRVEWYDMPEVRRITDDARKQDYRMSAFILGVTLSDAFRMKRAPAATQN